MKRIIILAMALILAATYSGAALAFAIVDIQNQGVWTDAQVWASGQPNPGAVGSNTFQDVIGNQFATDRITLVSTPNQYVIQIWTNNQPGGHVVRQVNFGVADLAFDVWPDQFVQYSGYTVTNFPAAVSRFEFGMDMQAYHTLGVPGQPGQGPVSLMLLTGWDTTFDWVNPMGGFNYGGGYRPSNQGGPAQAPVEATIAGGQVTGQGVMSWVVNDNTLNPNNNIPDYLITLTFPFSGPPVASYEVLWATARCGNDIVNGIVPAPVPGAVWLLGSGLLGLLGWRRRFSH